MLEVPVYNTDGKKTDTLKIDEAIFGGSVKTALLKQAVVVYHAKQHQGTVATRSRSMVSGSTRKLFKQKGTGNARRGPIRTNIMTGGGVAFGKIPHTPSVRLPRKMRRAALNSAILAKILGENLAVIDGLQIDSPRTKDLAVMMRNLKINRSCLLATAAMDRNVYLSSRNLQDLTVRTAAELNAFEVATRQKMLVTREAMQALIAREDQA